MQRRTVLTAAGAGALAAFASGCASTTEPVDPKNTSYSVLYGHIDSAAAPSKIEWVEVKQYGDRTKGQQGYYLISYDRKTGVFFHVGVEAGAHQVHKFGGGNAHYNWSSQGRNASALHIDKPGAYFAGAFKYVHHDEGWLKADKFEMRPVATPSEAQVLALVMQQLETDRALAPYEHQRALVRQRLIALGGRRA
jgi:hypothetical protein